MNHPHPTPGDVSRYWEKVDQRGVDACWSWTGGVGNHGYGVFYIGRKPTIASRTAFFLHYGRYPEGNACHRCDNPLCQNPHHLFDGTHAENARDKEMKGRGRHRLTPHDAAIIHILLGIGCTQAEVGARYGVAQTTISAIHTGKSFPRGGAR